MSPGAREVPEGGVEERLKVDCCASPGGRKEEQIQTELEVAQVRNRDDTLKRGLKDNCRIKKSCLSTGRSPTGSVPPCL